MKSVQNAVASAIELVAEGQAEVGFNLFDGGTSVGVHEDDVVLFRIIFAGGKHEFYFVIMSGFHGVERGAVSAAVSVFAELFGIHEQKADVGGIVADF